MTPPPRRRSSGGQDRRSRRVGTAVAKRGRMIGAAAVAGFGVAVGLHTSGSSVVALPAATPVRSTHQPSPTSAPPTTGAAGSSSGSGSDRGATGTTTPATTPATTSPTRTRSATGTVEQYGYGQLAVRATVSGTRITGLSVVGLQTAESYSQQIADQVIPMLRREVLAAQRVQVNGITGATYTTVAYLRSIQAALNKLHVS